MTLKELAQLGRDMRAKQRAYFAERGAERLEAAKKAERDFDAACDDVLDEARQPSLFDPRD